MTDFIFPKDLGLSTQNSKWISFAIHSVKGGVGLNPEQISEELGRINLPIPNDIGSDYANTWSSATVNARQSLGGVAVDATSDLFQGGVDALKNNLKSAGVDKRFYSNLGSSVGNAIKEWTLGGSAAQRSSGKALLSDTTVTYGGPGYRNFTFNFSLQPTNKKESESIHNIVKEFKLNSFPKTINKTGWRLYEIPNIFVIRFYSGNQEIKEINKINRCALQNISVKYGGTKFTTFNNNAPVQTNLSLTFQEIDLLDRESIEKGY